MSKSKKHKSNFKESNFKKEDNIIIKILKKIKYHVFEDESPVGWLAAFLVMFLLLKFIVIPLTSIVLNTNYPIVAVISGSMEHGLDSQKSLCGIKPINYAKNFDNWWNYCGDYYISNFDIEKEEFFEFSQKNGFNIGDVMILYGTKAENLKKGDVIVFEGGRTKPIIHRIVKIDIVDGKHFFTTKGDHNPESYYFEKEIPEDKYIGKAVLRIPLVGYIKIFAVDILNNIISIFKN